MSVQAHVHHKHLSKCRHAVGSRCHLSCNSGSVPCTHIGTRFLLLVRQIDDLFLTTEDAITGVGFRVTNADFTTHINWLKTINAAMPAGSSYK